ncbi:hypothetical protein CLIM01_14276 [Colletotrichum limetticola]|uniref:Uncharacterized protein n=1 Tax=Colletotrichum limetticola TaxID=1209924 RepID=A0ABQ9PBZ1_9PEZI|nr:hypothetical protein CLIM01_14276 [Colletotrichum limetticola]
MCLGAVVVLLVKTRDPPADVAMVLSLDTLCFVACSRIFSWSEPARGHEQALWMQNQCRG